MLNRLYRRVGASFGLLGLAVASSCQPTRDLDATTRGAPPPDPDYSAGSASGGSGSGAVDGGGTGGAVTDGGSASGGSSGTVSGTAGTAGTAGGSGPGAGGADFNAGGEASAGADAGGDPPPLEDLPNELARSPVQGVLTLSEMTVAGEKIFRIVSPIATYAVTASSGSITTLDDRSGGNIVQWVGTGGARRRRAGITASPQPLMTTTVDEASFTARHVRLRCASNTGAWAWTWDFYATQATLSITNAEEPYAFTFSGTPGDQLTSTDSVVQGSGFGQSAVNSLLAELTGPVEWAYLTDASYGHSLFLIQHDDDDLPDRYDAIGGDTATWVFGDGQATRAQRRFSIGFIASAVHANVVARAQYVIGAIPSP